MDYDLQELLEEVQRRKRENLITSFYPDKGSDGANHGFQPVVWTGTQNSSWPTEEDEQGNVVLLEPTKPYAETWSRHLYPQALYFFQAGQDYTFRALIAANQIGKTTTAGYECVLHATGLYPDWWAGLRFHTPPRIVIAGVDTKWMRKVIQKKLLGEVGELGTGLIPKDYIVFESLRDTQKAESMISSMQVRHASGGISTIDLISYESGVRAFYGFQADLIWLDEEPSVEIYEECKTRLITTGGKLMLTFTPLEGMSQTVENFLGSTDFITGPIKTTDGSRSSKMVVRCEWTDVPHVTYTAMNEQLQGMPESLRDAKSKGIPALGSGAVYPVNPETVFVEPFPIPKHWKRCFAMDFGWEDPTAVLWCAINPDDGVKFVYSEHYQSKAVTVIHADAIKQRNVQAGFKIPGVCDPSGGGRTSSDGKLVKDIYRNEHDLQMADSKNSLAPGIQQVLDNLATGKLFIFNTCPNTKAEYKKYRYEKGALKGADHLMDCLRYLILSGVDTAKSIDQFNRPANAGVSPRFQITRR